MATNLSQHLFCVAGNIRLAFEDSAPHVEGFVSARLRHHGIAHEFCPNRLADAGMGTEIIMTLKKKA
jgi:hypothetical protein